MKFQPSLEQTVDAACDAAQPSTTMMICDIPAGKGVCDLVEVINMHGCGGTYGLIYMDLSIQLGSGSRE